MQKIVEEFSRQDHNQRQLSEVTREGLEKRASLLRPTNKFKYIDGRWVPQPYKGYAVVSMYDAHPANEELSNLGAAIQAEITDAMELPDQLYMLPQASFHQTVVNTLSGNRFRDHIIDKGLEDEYPSIIESSFSKCVYERLADDIEIRFVGVSIFGSALGLLGIMDDDNHWNAIMNLRDHMYTDAELNAHDIRRTRPFVAHTTLGYIDGELSAGNRNKLVDCLDGINQRIDFEKAIFSIRQTELRTYNHLDVFDSQPHFPIFKFC